MANMPPLIFRIRADTTEVQAAIANARAAMVELREALASIPFTLETEPAPTE